MAWDRRTDRDRWNATLNAAYQVGPHNKWYIFDFINQSIIY